MFSLWKDRVGAVCPIDFCSSFLIPFCLLEVSLGFPKSFADTDFRCSLLSCKTSVEYSLSLHFAYIPQMLREWFLTCIHFKNTCVIFLKFMFLRLYTWHGTFKVKRQPRSVGSLPLYVSCGSDSVCEFWRAVTLPTKSSLWSLKSFKLLLILSPC